MESRLQSHPQRGKGGGAKSTFKLPKSQDLDISSSAQANAFKRSMMARNDESSLQSS